MLAPRLNGYLPEDVRPEHWTNDRIKPQILKALGNIAFDLGSVDLRSSCSPVQDQRNLGSCVAQALVHALELKRIQQYGREKHVDLSTLHLYYLARELMRPSRTHEDSGTHISTACDALRKIGICTEDLWPYIPGKYRVAPPVSAIREAYVNKIRAFHRIVSSGPDRVTDVLIHLHAGNPVVYGTAVTEKFLRTRGTDVVGAANGKIIGRHAMCIVGWIADRSVLVVQNSWGARFGDSGFFYASPDHITDPNAEDFWTITGGFEAWAP